MSDPYLAVEEDPYLAAESEADPYLDAPITERAGNAAKAGAQGVVTSVGQSISGLARTADTIKEGALLTSVPPGTAKPTIRQSRRAFEQAMNDPRYMTALTEAGDDPTMLAQAERFFGPTAKLDVIRTPIDEGRKMAAEESAAQQKRLDLDSPMYAFGKGLVEAGKEVYATDPYLDTKFESKVTRSLGSTVPSVALGLVPGGMPAAVSQYALSQSEDMAQEALDAGRPDLAMQAATAGLFIGALSEATLGATARLRSILKNPTSVKALEGWAKANPIKATALIAGVREAGQEGVEQTLQNKTASDMVGYDPERPWHRQVLESMVLGGIGGGIFGGGGALIQRAGKATSDNPAEAEAVAELNAALDAFQSTPDQPVQTSERITTLDVAPPTIEGAQGELIPIPAAETPAPEIITPEQRMSREAVNAMAELRKLKEAAKQHGQELPASGVQVQSAEPNADAVVVGTLPTQADVDLAAGRTPAIAGKAEPIPPRPAEPTGKPDLQVEQKPAKATKRRPTLNPRPDGVPDILDAIADLGGIKAPGSQKGTAEYDGYAAAFNEGGPAAVLRGGSNRPDLLLQDLQSMGWKFQTIDDMYGAVSKASNARGALAAQLKAERTVRPEMVQRVQELYDAAKQGVALAPDTLAELESQLNQKELRTLKGPLAELLHLANVAVAEPADTTPMAQAKAEVREAWQAMQQMGIMADPKRDAEKAFALYKALFKLAVAATKQGIRTAEEFAAKYGVKMSAIVTSAWGDAQSGKAKTAALQLEPGAVAELVDDMQERKFSRRFAEDERMAPELRDATGNDKYVPVPNAMTAGEALQVIRENGIDAALVLLKDEQNVLSARERVALAQAIVMKLNHEYAATKNEAVLDKAVDVAEWVTEYGTKLGQGVQAFAIWNRLTPEGYVQAYVRAVKNSTKGTRGAPVPPQIEPETKRKIHKQAKEALDKPEGFQRDEAIVDVLAQIAKAKGVSKMDVALALWYANILSGWTTQVRNMAGNLSNLLAESFAHAAVRPQHLPDVLAGLYNGFLRGLPEAVNILRRGKVTGTRVGKIDAPPVLEMIRFRGVAYPLNAWKYVFRVMAATDMTVFRSAEEMRMRFMARELARSEGLSGSALAKRLAEVLHNTAAQRDAATAQATSEGLTGLALKRRVAEIMEQARPAELVAEAADYGRFATYNQDPEGVMGVIAQGINSVSRQFAPMRLIVPFTRVVANVTNNALNYTPWGYRRLFPSAFMDKNWMEDNATPLDYQLQAARATLGTLALVSLYALAAQHWDDDDPPFMLTANGPQDPDARKQLRETGWEPYTVKIGDRYWSYRETPLHLVMATLGSLLDATRYKKLDETDALTRYTYAMQQIGKAPLNQSFLRGLADFFDGLSDDRVPRSGVKFSGFSRTASSLLVPNLAKQIDKLFDPNVYDATTVQGALLRDVPVARRGLDPVLNILGEPVRSDLNPFYSLERPDPLWTLIGQRQLWIPVPSRTLMIGDRPITPEEYSGLIATSGPAIRSRLETIMPFLESVPQELAQDRISQITREERAAARRRMGIAR